jgi:hypothetical protein
LTQLRFAGIARRRIEMWRRMCIFAEEGGKWPPTHPSLAELPGLQTARPRSRSRKISPQCLFSLFGQSANWQAMINDETAAVDAAVRDEKHW